MARPGGAETRSKILDATRYWVTKRGLATLTLEAIAQEVGLTKQAVIYHFANKEGLLRELYLEAITRECAALERALERAGDVAETVEAFWAEFLRYHLRDLSSFRLVYLLAQTTAINVTLISQEDREKRLYPATRAMYDAFEARLATSPGLSGESPRRLAVALHLSAIGFACMAGLLESAGDPLKHRYEDLARDFCSVIVRGLGVAPKRKKKRSVSSPRRKPSVRPRATGRARG